MAGHHGGRGAQRLPGGRGRGCRGIPAGEFSGGGHRVSLAVGAARTAPFWDNRGMRQVITLVMVLVSCLLMGELGLQAAPPMTALTIEVKTLSGNPVER